MADTVSLNLQRATKEKDCRLCSAVDVLEELLEDIRSGNTEMPEMMYIALRTRNSDDPNLIHYDYRCCGGSNIELSGLLGIHHHRLSMPGDF